MPHRRVLIVDDEADLRWVLRGLLEDAGCTVAEAGDGTEALLAIERELPDVVLSDVRMPRLTGTELLHELQRSHPDLPVVLLSAVEDIATAVSAIRDGAFDYQQKPFDQERLLLSVTRAAEQHALRREVAALRAGHGTAPGDFGDSRKARRLLQQVALVAPQRSLAVLLVGESGTGKEVVARAIHARSPNAEGPFVAVDCGALPEPLLESQLFGHERGAFTGADRARTGLFAMADGGTLFLDELGNLPLLLQAKLLRALQERSVMPVGGSRPVPFDARIVAATNTDLQQAVREGRFRIDLYHRLAEFLIDLPPLRERPEDIAGFAARFLAEANREMGRHVLGFTAAAGERLTTAPWPGNLRELRNVVRRAVLACPGSEIDAPDLELPDHGSPHGQTGMATDPRSLAERMRSATEELEARILRETLAECQGNKAAAARALQIDYTTLHRKLKRHGG